MINEKVISLCKYNNIKIVLNEKEKLEGNRTSYYYDLACVVINDEFVTTTIQETRRFMLELKNFNNIDDNDVYFAVATKKDTQGKELKSLKFKKEMLYSDKAIYINYNSAATIYSIYYDITFGKLQALSYSLSEGVRKEILKQISNSYKIKVATETNSFEEKFNKIINHFEKIGDEDLIVRLKKCFDYLLKNTFILKKPLTVKPKTFFESEFTTTWLVYYSNDFIIDIFEWKIADEISDENSILLTIFYVIFESMHIKNEIEFEDFVNAVFGDYPNKADLFKQVNDNSTYSSTTHLKMSYSEFIQENVPKLYYKDL